MLLLRAHLDSVRKGQALARMFVPECAGGQAECLALKGNAAPGAGDLARAARNRLLLIGMSEEQIASVDRDGKPVTSITLASPADGVVGDLGVREGMNVMPGTTLFRINGLGSVWVNVEIPEAQVASIRAGTPISATVPAYPGERFQGKLSPVLPEAKP